MHYSHWRKREQSVTFFVLLTSLSFSCLIEEALLLLFVIYLIVFLLEIKTLSFCYCWNACKVCSKRAHMIIAAAASQKTYVLGLKVLLDHLFFLKQNIHFEYLPTPQNLKCFWLFRVDPTQSSIFTKTLFVSLSACVKLYVSYLFRRHVLRERYVKENLFLSNDNVFPSVTLSQVKWNISCIKPSFCCFAIKKAQWLKASWLRMVCQGLKVHQYFSWFVSKKNNNNFCWSVHCSRSFSHFLYENFLLLSNIVLLLAFLYLSTSLKVNHFASELIYY